jgi:acyl-homoserine-lactone acylase
MKFMATAIAAVGIGAVAAASEPPPAPPSRAALHEVQLYRDSYGMAHLYAHREEDAFFGLGYATAEDRLQQVLTWYVAVRGELAATFGRKTPVLPGDSPGRGGLSDTVASDMAARQFGFLASARHNLGALPPQYRRDLEAYVDGLRVYMRQHPAKTPSWAPPLEPALPLALFDSQVKEAAGVCDARRSADRAATKTAARAASDSQQWPLGASNAWVVAPSRTADGHVIFESDSHSPVEGYGMAFYPYRIKAGDLDVTVFEPSGTARFLFGYSPHFAWGITEALRYPADCYRVTVEPASPRKFKYDDRIQTMRTVPYTIAIKGEPAIHGTFEYTNHNGVSSPVVAREDNVAYVVSYASADRVGLGAGEYYRFAKARTRADLEAALEQRDAYPANAVFGGADGTTIYIRPGRIPIRPPGLDVTHTLDGNHSSTAWRGIHSYTQALKLIDPPQGYIANTNVSPDMMYPRSPMQPSDYPSYYAFQPGRTNSREERLTELLGQTTQLTLSDALSFAMDENITEARPWAAAVAEAMRAQPALVAAQPSGVRSFLEELTRFDGTLAKESRGALDHSELRRALVEGHREEADALGDTIRGGGTLSEDQQRLLVEAAAAGWQHLLDRYGRTDLTWGDVHRIGRGGVDLPIGGGLLIAGVSRGGSAAYTFNLDVSPPVVGSASLRALSFIFDKNLGKQRMVGGQRVPFVVQFLAEGSQGYAQTLWGVSEDPASPHYSDQARLASEKILRPIPQTLEALRREGATETTLDVPVRADQGAVKAGTAAR